MGLKSKIEEKLFWRGAYGELTAKKWLDSIEKQKRRSNLKRRDRRTSGQRDTSTDDRVNC